MPPLSPEEIQQRFERLSLPLRHLRTEITPTIIRDLPPEARKAVNSQHVISTIRACGGFSQMPLLAIGDLTCLVGRVTPTRLQMEADDQISFHLAYSGRSAIDMASGSHILHCGESMAFRNQSGVQRIGFGSGIGFQLQPERLRRSLNAIAGRDDLHLPGEGVLSHLNPEQTTPFRTLFQLVDQLLLDDPCIPQMLGFDEQLYRLLAIQLLRSLGLLDRVCNGRAAVVAPSTAVIDRLVFYIEAHADQPLTLTDLERCCGYSARRLQQLFRQRFDCTPMQFVRRQRLHKARQHLEQYAASETITSVARRFGYRHVSHFSADFRQQFGTPPSQLLHAARCQGLW